MKRIEQVSYDAYFADVGVPVRDHWCHFGSVRTTPTTSLASSALSLRAGFLLTRLDGIFEQVNLLCSSSPLVERRRDDLSVERRFWSAQVE